MKYKYGYKISLKKLTYKKPKIYLLINTLEGAIWNIRWYQNKPEYQKNKYIIYTQFWFLEKIKGWKEYNKYWKDCPFKDDFSQLKRRKK